MKPKIVLQLALITLTFVLIGFGLTSCIQTPSGGGLFIRSTNAVPVLSTNDTIVLTNYVTNVIVQVNPGVTNALGIGQKLAKEAPTPWGGLAAGALAIVSAVLGAIAKVKSDKAALVPALIAGVEAVNHAESKESIKTVATAAGVQPLLDREVQRLSRGK